MQKTSIIIGILACSLLSAMEKEKPIELKSISKPSYAKQTAVLGWFLLPDIIEIVKGYSLPQHPWQTLSTGLSIHNHQCTTGNELVAHHHERTSIYALPGNQELDRFTFDFETIPKRQLHPDGTTLLHVNDGILSFYDRTTKQATKFECPHRVYGATISPRGTYLGIVHQEGLDVVWYKTKKKLKHIAMPQSIVAQRLTFSTDERKLAYKTWSTVTLHDITKQAKKDAYQVLQGHTEDINSIAFSRNNKHVLTASNDHTALLWDSTTGKILRAYAHPAWVMNAQFGANENWIATGCIDGSMRFFDTDSGEYLPSEGSPRWQQIVVSSDGSMVAARDSGTIHYFINPITYLQHVDAAERQNQKLATQKPVAKEPIQNKRKREEAEE